MIAFTFTADDSPRERHHLVSPAPTVTGLAVDARGAVQADGTAGVGARTSSAPAGSGPDSEDLAVDDLVTAAPLTGTVGYLYTFDAVEVQT